MKKILLAGLATAFSLSFSACNNGNYDANPNVNNSNVLNPLNNSNAGILYLTSGTWKIDSYVMVNGTDTTDLLALVSDCEKDDIFTFNADNTITKDEGATKCSTSDPQTSSDGTWSINGNNYTGTGSNGSLTWNIVILDNYTFEISADQTINGVVYTAIETYKRP